MNEHQGDEIVSVLKEILNSLDHIEAKLEALEHQGENTGDAGNGPAASSPNSSGFFHF